MLFAFVAFNRQRGEGKIAAFAAQRLDLMQPCGMLADTENDVCRGRIQGFGVVDDEFAQRMGQAIKKCAVLRTHLLGGFRCVRHVCARRGFGYEVVAPCRNIR